MTISKVVLLPALVGTALLLAGCGSDDDTGTNTDDTSAEQTVNDATDEADTSIGRIGNFDSAMFGDALISAGEESCILDDGTETTCMRLVFEANGAGDTEGDGTVGPYCPESTTSPYNESGFGIYDGPTTPGFQPLIDAAIAMDADGFDIVDDEGNINSSDLSGTPVEGLSYCLVPPFVSDIEISFLIPVTPEFRGEPWSIGTAEGVAVGILGVPYKGVAPGVAIAEEGVGGSGSGNIPGIDHCGGHTDPSGYYHWHLVPQGLNALWGADNFNFTQDHDITCSNSTVDVADSSSFVALAKDGFPLYGPRDSVNGVDTDPSEVGTLDACHGHAHVTDEFPDGVYHYHAHDDVAPNLPACLMGKFVNRDMSVSGVEGGMGGGGPPPGGE